MDNVPVQMKERIECTIAASVYYRVPANIMLAIAEKENGRIGQWVKNTNGTDDVGPMQFNTSYLAELKKFGIEPKDVEGQGCYAYKLATWRVAGHLKRDKGDIWTRAANYHSRTPELNATYRNDLIVKAGRWGNWIKQRYETVNVTVYANK